MASMMWTAMGTKESPSGCSGSMLPVKIKGNANGRKCSLKTFWLENFKTRGVA